MEVFGTLDEAFIGPVGALFCRDAEQNMLDDGWFDEHLLAQR